MEHQISGWQFWIEEGGRTRLLCVGIEEYFAAENAAVRVAGYGIVLSGRRISAAVVEATSGPGKVAELLGANYRAPLPASAGVSRHDIHGQH